MNDDPRLLAVVLAGGILFGFGLGFSEMARPEVVLSFLQLQDLGLLFVMAGGTVVVGIAIAIGVASGRTAPLTGEPYRRRLKSFDRDVLSGGGFFGVGWGLTGMCPGAAYASLGIGNYPILIGIVGMFAGAYLQGLWRSRAAADHGTVEPADD